MDAARLGINRSKFPHRSKSDELRNEVDPADVGVDATDVAVLRDGEANESKGAKSGVLDDARRFGDFGIGNDILNQFFSLHKDNADRSARKGWNWQLI